MNENFDAFDDYALTFDMNVDMIKYKYNHTYRVVHQAEEICRSLNMDTIERDLASNIALLHDIARFKQWTEYQTFKDNEIFDHGDEAIKILFDDKLIDRFTLNKEDYDVIKIAIKNHNKIKITGTNNDRELLHSKIVRDADKLDILYAFSTNRLLEIKNNDEEISEKVKDAFFKHEQVDNKNVKSVNDKLITMFGLVYDINFDYSKNRIYEEKYIDKIYEVLKNKDIFKPYVDEINKYLKGELKNDR